MKRKLLTFALSFLTVGLLGSCSKTDECIDSTSELINANGTMIQSVTILPAYADGSVEALDGILTVDFIVSPAASVAEVTKDSIKVLVHEVKGQTKVTSYTTLPVESAIVDDSTGDVTITADISGSTPAEGINLAVALNVRNGISDFTSEFVPVHFAQAPIYYLPGVFTVNTKGKKVHFAKGNLWYGPATSGASATFNFETNQYNFPSKFDASHISHFYWSKDESVACAEPYSDDSWDINDVFFTNDPTNKEKANANFIVSGAKGKYRTLSSEEWQYLLSDRPRADQLCKYGVTVCGIPNCLIIAPDGYGQIICQTYEESVWLFAEASEGLVCLPPAGTKSAGIGEKGFYWSSSAGPYDDAFAMTFLSDFIKVGLSTRSCHYSVRLVTDSE